MVTLLSLCFTLLVAFYCSRVAEQRGRRPHVWFWIGVFFGLPGLITLFLLPKAVAEEPKSEQEIVVAAAEPLEPDPRTQSWFFVDSARAQQGPVTFRRLFTAWRDQLISADSLVWTEGMPEWQPIGQLPGLMDKLSLE